MPSAEASRRNLQKARNMGRVLLRRGRDETALIKLLTWQICFERSPRPSQRFIARQLRVSQPYICKVMRKATTVGFYELAKNGRATIEELEQARKVSDRLRESGMLRPARQPLELDRVRDMTTDEIIAERWRDVRVWKRANPTPRRLLAWIALR